MQAWVHLFSKFTSEALLFEASAIFLLMAIYTAFWVLKKRRLGSFQNVIPSGLVKTYLLELINEAHLLRKQFFGILNQAGVSKGDTAKLLASVDVSSSVSAEAAEKIAADPELKKKLTQLEANLKEQTAKAEGLVKEKKEIEKALEAAKSGAAAGAAEGAGGAEVDELKKKIKELEAKLAEYSVIEDDLANLKRLQQENKKLKAAMEGKGIELPEEPAEEAPTEENKAAPATEAPAEAATVAAAETPSEEPTPEAATEVAQADAEAAPAADTTGDPNFEGLVDKVEESLKPEAAAEGAPAEVPAPTEKEEEAKKEEGAAPAAGAKSDDDLLDEFEKMLNM